MKFLALLPAVGWRLLAAKELAGMRLDQITAEIADNLRFPDPQQGYTAFGFEIRDHKVMTVFLGGWWLEWSGQKRLHVAAEEQTTAKPRIYVSVIVKAVLLGCRSQQLGAQQLWFRYRN